MRRTRAAPQQLTTILDLRAGEDCAGVGVLQSGHEPRRRANNADLRGHAHFAQKIFADALHVEVDAARRLRDKINRAELERFQSAVGPFARFGADDDDGPRIRRHDLRGGLEPINVGHVDVHRDDIGLERFRECHSFTAIFCLADDLQHLIRTDDVLENFAHERRVIDDQNAKFLDGGDGRHSVDHATGTGRIASDPMSCSTAAMS